MKVSLKAVRKILGKITDVLLIGRNKGWWSKGQGPKVKALLASLVLFGACAGLPRLDLDCRVTGCSGEFACVRDADKVSQWSCAPMPPPVTVPPASPEPPASPSPTPPIVSPSMPPTPPDPSPSPTPTPKPSPTPCTTVTTQPAHGKIDRPNGPWLSYAPPQIVKDKSAGQTYERMYRWIDGPRPGEKVKDDCSTPSEKIQWARKTTNWACPDSYPGNPGSCTVDGNPAPCPTYDAAYGNGFCYSTGEGRQRTDRQSAHVDQAGRVLHEPDLDGYTGITCPAALAPAVTSVCATPAPPSSPTPPASPVPPGTPSPGATPATCPRLARVGGGLFNCQNSVSQPKACDALEAGDALVIDSTHHFGRRNTASCDEPWDIACGGRICDDQANGTKFAVLQGGSRARKTGTHQLKVGPLVSGTHRVELCPNDDYRDALGFPVDTAGAECTVVEWSVR